MQNNPFTFFGTPELAVFVLDELEKAGLVPARIVTAPDAPKGRGLIMTPSPVKEWAKMRGIHVNTPVSLKKLTDEEFDALFPGDHQFALLAAYGKIIPQKLIERFPKGIINVHPSLLPLYRGASPLEYQILDNAQEYGVTLIKLDAECDHGPVIGMREIHFNPIPPKKSVLGETAFREGGKMIAQYLHPYLTGVLTPFEQDHSKATFTKKITKEMGLLNLADDEGLNYRKFLAYEGWPGTYFFENIQGKQIRVIIKDAELKDGKFLPTKVIPEGKKEMLYSDFLRGIQK